MADIPNIYGLNKAVGSREDWLVTNVALPAGVVIITTDGYITIGNGTSLYSELAPVFDPTALSVVPLKPSVLRWMPCTGTMGSGGIWAYYLNNGTYVGVAAGGTVIASGATGFMWRIE